MDATKDLQLQQQQLPCCRSHSRLCKGQLSHVQYLHKGLLIINIFKSKPSFVFQDPYAKRFMKDEKITKTAYIANSGGLLGLCMGFSLVSAAEILYHCLFGLFSPICGRGKKSTKVTILYIGSTKRNYFSIQDTLYRVYTYSRDLENGLCDRHKKAEIVSLSDTQKQDPNHAKNQYNGNVKKRVKGTHMSHIPGMAWLSFHVRYTYVSWLGCDL